MRSARAAGKDEPLLPDRERPERSGSGRRSLLISVFNVVNTTFGTGFFLYPKALVANGVGIGLAAVCALLALVVFSLHSLADAVGRSPASLTAYPETIGYFSRPWCARVISASIQIYLVGAGAAYLALYLRRRSCTLRSIELNDCGVGELGCKAIGGALEDNATVRCLQLDLNAFGDAGARALGASLPSNKGLTSLSMQYCGLTEAAGAILAGGVLRLPSLASLELRGNDLGSGGVVEVLRALVPLHAGGQPHPAMAHLGVADTGCAIEGELHEALTACFDENPLCGSFDMRGAPLGDTTAYELITLFKKVHTHVHAFEVSATSGWGPLDPQLYKQIYAVTAANQKGKKGGKKGKKGKKAAASPSASDDDGEDNIADLLAAMAKGSDDELD